MNTEEYKKLFRKIGFIEETNRIFKSLEERIINLELKISDLEATVVNMKQKS